MKAFLSHSSKDKSFVSQVYAKLGDAQAEYDEQTFDQTLNVQAIRNALRRSDVFVQFLSRNSVGSSYVAEEQREALEQMGKGTLKRILIFAIDDTTYRALPEWLQEYNVVQRVTNPRLAASRIQSTLVSLQTETTGSQEIFVNREEELQTLRRALAAPPGIAPVVLQVSGFYGIGRRTLIKHCLQQVFPKIDIPIEITLAGEEGPEEIYRRLYDLHRNGSIAEKASEFDRFAKQSDEDQASDIAALLVEMSSKGDFIIVNDDGGILADDGDYQPHIRRIVSMLDGLSRPILGIIQTRRMRPINQEKYPLSFHIGLSTLRDDHVRELLSFGMKQLGIGFDQDQLNQLSELIDGHPFNAKFATQYAASYGLSSLLSAPQELVEWKRKRANEFISQIDFDPVATQILSLARSFRYLAIETMVDVLDYNADEIAHALRQLEDICCLERRGNYYAIPRPLIDAINRDARFDSTPMWEREVALRMTSALSSYTDDDHVSIEVIETAALAAVKSGSEQGARYVTAFLLPSHLLRIAKSYYDGRSWGHCLEFCDKAYEMGRRLTVEAKIAALRLMGLSSARLDNDERFEFSAAELEKTGTTNALRQANFIKGFRERLRGNWDEAEKHYLEAYKVSRNNLSINRELAAIYCNQGRYSDAEGHARSAYEIAPTNPFVIDILARVLSGKINEGLLSDTRELDDLMVQLEKHGNEPGISFYDLRQADRFLKQRNIPAALRSVNSAISKTPSLIEARCLRAEINISANAVSEAEKDLQEISRLLEQAGGHSPEDEARLAELQVKVHIERREFQLAKDKAERTNVLPSFVSRKLLRLISRAIGFEPLHASPGLQKWAKNYKG